MTENYRKHWAEFYREILLFFAILFFTCVVGIIELLPELEKINGLLSWSCLALSSLYFGLVIGVDYSLDRCFLLYKQNKAYGGKFAFVYPELEVYVKKIFKKVEILEGFLLVIVSLVLVLLYFVKIGLLI